MTLAIAVALLSSVGTFLIVRGGPVRLILGFILLGHAANLVIIAAGGSFRREAALVDGGPRIETMADPLPQAFVLTAIVITFGVTVYLLSLVARTARPPRARSAAAKRRTPAGSAPGSSAAPATSAAPSAPASAATASSAAQAATAPSAPAPAAEGGDTDD